MILPAVARSQELLKPPIPEKSDSQLAAPLLVPPDLASPVDAGHMVGPFDILDKVENLEVVMHAASCCAPKVDILRSAVVDPSVCDLVQFSPHEVSIIGKSQGATNVTFWFRDPKLLPRPSW